MSNNTLAAQEVDNQLDMRVPTKLDFAQEVRAERLSVLWKITIVVTVFMVWGALIVTSLTPGGSFVEILLPTIAVTVGCLGTRFLLAQSRYAEAVWTYTAGMIIAVCVILYGKGDPQSTARDLMPFAFPMIIVTVGLLLSIQSTLVSLAISVIVTVIVPSLGRTITLTQGQIFGILLMVIAAAIAMQISGQLYGIAEWALESYRKERAIRNQLFDTQQEVQRSYMRQKALAEELQQTNEELETARAAALEAKNFRGQFLANMSHELRTPLNAIIGFSETMLNFPMMYQNQELPPAYRGDLTQIYTSGKHLLQLINDILDLSKVDVGKLEMEIEQVDLDPIFKGVLATAVGLVGGKPIKLKRETPARLPTVRGDSLRIRQVILNLMSNASKFTDEGTITLGARLDGGEVTVWVADSGIGIAPQEMDKIFEEFRQGASGRRKGRAGSGLGLAISRQLLNLMGGRIWVESIPGKGSSFFFTLPVYVAEAVEQQG